MKQPIDLERIRERAGLRSVPNCKEDVVALLDEVERLQKENRLLQKMAAAKSDCWLNPKEDCAVWVKNARLQGLLDAYETLMVCPGCHALDIDADGFCDCGDKAIPIQEWMHIWRGFGEREGG
ncbi:hypothetical protein LJC49_04565 [Ruminococcaceae bacterium OttesenSCG-928-I18]|nr:hypothetical protein [Ruminococcaceae bacterium OttesenSCG-928-I18]